VTPPTESTPEVKQVAARQREIVTQRHEKTVSHQPLDESTFVCLWQQVQARESPPPEARETPGGIQAGVFTLKVHSWEFILDANFKTLVETMQRSWKPNIGPHAKQEARTEEIKTCGWRPFNDLEV